MSSKREFKGQNSGGGNAGVSPALAGESDAASMAWRDARLKGSERRACAKIISRNLRASESV
jgi:hypothetical protein